MKGKFIVWTKQNAYSHNTNKFNSHPKDQIYNLIFKFITFVLKKRKESKLTVLILTSVENWGLIIMPDRNQTCRVVIGGDRD